LEDGGICTWGGNGHGRLGHHHFGDACIAAVAAGNDHSAALTEDGALYTWGQGAGDKHDAVPGGLGHADLLDRLLPTAVPPHLFDGARLERWHRLPKEDALAFAMGTHNRLGDGSRMAVMPELVRQVLEGERGAGAGGDGGGGGAAYKGRGQGAAGG